MSIYLFTNNTFTNLASDISSSATTLTVTTGTGSDFPTITAGTVFKITLLDAATQLTNEIMLVTARTGDNFTVVRGQEGTTAIAWAAGAIVSLLVTTGELENFVQSDQLQNNEYQYALGGGTANAITATFPSNITLTDVPDGFSCYITAPAANTAAAYLTLTFGSTVCPTHQIVKNNQVALSAGDIPAQYYPMELVYSAQWGQFVIGNPTFAVASSISGGGAKELLVQTAANTTGFITAPVTTNSFLGYNGTNILWEALPTVTTAVNLAGGTQYQIPYQNAANTTVFAPAPSVAGSLLSYTGSGFAWATGITASSLKTANFTITESGGKLIVQYGSTTIVSISSEGIITALSSIIAAGTP